MPNANLPSPVVMPDVPSIDDCDFLFTASNRRGTIALYARAQEFEFDGNVYFATALTIDSDEGHFVEDVEFPTYANSLGQVASWLAESAIETFGPNRYSLCSETKKMKRRK